MKLRYILISLVFLIAFPSGCRWKKPVPNTPGPPQQLSIILSLGKPNYQLNEAIQASVKIINTGAPVMINIRFAEQCLQPQDENWEISFLIYDSKGQQYTPPRCINVDYAEPWYQHLDKRGEYEYPYNNLLDYYRLKEPGKYTIQAIYHNVYGSEDVWKGEIKSNIVTLTINP